MKSLRKNMLLLLVMIFTMLISVIPVQAKDPDKAPLPEIIWRDDEVLVTYPASPTEASMSMIYQPGAELLPIEPAVSSTSSGISAMPFYAAAVSGHFRDPFSESVLHASCAGTELQLTMLGDTEPLARLSPVFTMGSLLFMDLAAGELDLRVTNAAGSAYDEVAVAYLLPPADGVFPIEVSVINMTGLPRTTVRTAGGVNKADLDSGRIVLGDSELAVEVADFNGCGTDEIAVAYISSQNQLNIELFRYGVDTTLTPAAGTLTAIGSYSVSTTGSWSTSLSAASGDFDGNGREDLALGTVNKSGEKYQQNVRLFSFSGETELTAVPKASHLLSENYNPQSRVELAAGLFHFNPADGYGLNRRQLGAAFSGTADINQANNVEIAVMDVSSEWEVTRSDRTQVTGAPVAFSLAAGRFRQRTAQSNLEDYPIWDLAVAGWQAAPNQISVELYETGFQEGTGGLPAYPKSPFLASNISRPAKDNPDSAARIPLAAVDHDGDSLMLGTPVHYTVNNLVQTSYILQEPPKHMYYDPAAKAIVNVTRKDGFNISLLKSGTAVQTLSSKSIASSSFGTTSTASAGITAGASGSFSILSLGAEASVAVDKMMSDLLEKTEASFQSTSTTAETRLEAVTGYSDLVIFKLQPVHIWRYPIHGLDDVFGDRQPYVDFTIPGTEITKYASGDTLDWYQPLHENGNVLSYPESTGFSPGDLGYYTLPGTGDPLRGMLYSGERFNTDDTIINKELKWTETSGGSSERIFTNTVTKNDSIKTSASVTAGIPGFNLKLDTAYSFERSNGTSWSGTDLNEVSLTNSTGILLTKPSMSNETYYEFDPFFYVANDGTIKASFTVGTPTISYWKNLYGQKPDFALNLPKRFLKSGDSWQVNEGVSRKSMRGFFITGVNPETNTEYDIMPESVISEEDVNLTARVYNYSIGTTPAPANTGVRFTYTRLDNDGKELDSPRILIQDTNIGTSELIPRGVREVSVTWPTPKIENPSELIRIYVELDPGNSVTEKNETEKPGALDPNQNNEGFYDITLVKKPGRLTGLREPADVFMTAKSIAIQNASGKLKDKQTSVQAGKTSPVRIMVGTSRSSFATNTVMLYDGRPENGGNLIGMTNTFTGDPRGNYVWFDWTPQTAGKYTLYAEVIESADDALLGNSSDTLSVMVTPAPKK